MSPISSSPRGARALARSLGSLARHTARLSSSLLLFLVSLKCVQASSSRTILRAIRQPTRNEAAQMLALARGTRLAAVPKNLPLSRRGFAQTSTRRLPVDPAAFVQQGKKVHLLSSMVPHGSGGRLSTPAR